MCCGSARTSCPWARRGLGEEGEGVHAGAALCPCRHLQRGEKEEEALPLVQAVMLLPIRWVTESSSTASRPFLSQT